MTPTSLRTSLLPRAARPWAAGLLLACLPAAGAQPPAEVFGEVLDVRVVNLEVVVTNRRGERVTGLGPEDFRLLVDGEETPIDYFTEVRDGRVPSDAGRPIQTAAPPAAGGADEPVPTRYLLFIDEMFGVGSHRDRVLRRLADQVDALGPEDEMAVVAFDGRRLQVLSGWTGSAETLQRVLAAAAERESHGALRIAEYRRLRQLERQMKEISEINDRPLARMAHAPVFGPGAQEAFGHDITADLSGRQQAYAALLSGQIEGVLDAARAAMRSFAGGTGRKALVLLSGGWPYEPAEVASDEGGGLGKGSIPGLANVPGGEELFAPLVESANRLGYTIYPVDLPGLQGQSDLIEAKYEAGPVQQLGEHVQQVSLLHLAEETGGRALLNDLRDSALTAAVRDTRSYYWLGFTPEEDASGAERRIEVRVLRPGLATRARSSFRGLTREAEAEAQVEGFLYVGLPEGERLPVRLGKVERVPKQTRRMVVPIEVAVPVRAVTLLQQGDEWVGTAELRLAAVDDRGGRSDIPVVTLDVRMGHEPEPFAYLQYETRLLLRAEPQELVVALHDPLSGGFVAERLEVTPPPE